MVRIQDLFLMAESLYGHVFNKFKGEDIYIGYHI